MANAVKFVPKLKELRIHLCSRSESSKGVREFIQKSYVGLKKANPKFPILIRECSGVQPKIWARYGIYFVFPQLMNAFLINFLSQFYIFMLIL